MPEQDADSFTAIVFNDLHQRYATYKALCKQIEGIDYDFVIFNGDCIDDPANHDQATRFVILDCGEDKVDDHREYFGLNDFTALRNEQVGFIQQELASKEFKKADKRILIHHIPLFCFPHNLCNDLWRPLLKKADFDVCLNAHTHRAAFHPKGEDGNRFPIFIGGGYKLEEATVIIIEKTKNRLKVRMLNAEGKVLAEMDE